MLRPVVVLLVLSSSVVHADDATLREQAKTTLHKAASYYSTRVATHGGYVYYYSPDLRERWGEGKASEDQIWVQPPGTPTVGLAFLKAYAATGEKFYLEAAVRAAESLMYGQLVSGGWRNCVDFNPRGEQVAQYRKGRGRGSNNSTLDDGISQAAIRLMMRVDQALEFKRADIHESAETALAALLAAQFPNGAFPQVWTGPVKPQPVVKPSYPEYDWRTEGKVKNYWDMYTLNDNVAGNVARALIDAADIYKDKKYQAALARLGDFLVLAQMPEPQPAWAQQYDYAMRPIWARRFEPPAITGGESQDAMETLLTIAENTGYRKYLDPIPRARDYLRRSLLPDGQLARYYELQTNKPLYMERDGDRYTLTYDDSKLPQHYGWKRSSRLDEIERRYQALIKNTPTPEAKPSSAEFAARVRTVVDSLDDEGRWISVYAGEGLVGQPKFATGTRYISSAVFSENVELLSEFLLEAK